MTFLVTVGTTETALIDGISAAGANPDVMSHTPSADVEILAYGRPVFAPFVPVSPSGCPTPSLITRGVMDLLDLDLRVVDAGLTEPTAAPTISLGATQGGDVREPEPVPTAAGIAGRGRDLAETIGDDTTDKTGDDMADATGEELVLAESIPGGTTTALGVLTALGEDIPVSSSLPENPLELKRSVVEEGLSASDIEGGDLAGDPVEAVRRMGDPTLAALYGLIAGAAEAGAGLTLAGGTQMLAAAALARHGGVTAPITVATTSFVDGDESTDLQQAAADLDLSLAVIDPGFDQEDHVAFERYRMGEAKEGVGMGGALYLADRADVSMAAVRERIIDRYERLVEGDGSG
jgi:uncharacterized protein (TIGR00303 family)